jgi:hypothetical protein
VLQRFSRFDLLWLTTNPKVPATQGFSALPVSSDPSSDASSDTLIHFATCDDVSANVALPSGTGNNLASCHIDSLPRAATRAELGAVTLEVPTMGEKVEHDISPSA